jgi:hypothetical protein
MIFTLGADRNEFLGVGRSLVRPKPRQLELQMKLLTFAKT